MAHSDSLVKMAEDLSTCVAKAALKTVYAFACSVGNAYTCNVLNVFVSAPQLAMLMGLVRK